MTVKYRVEIVDIASKDINQIYQYIKKYDCIENARYVFNQLRETIKKLEILPQRGSHPYELYEYGMIGYREITGMSILSHTTKLRGNGLLNAIGVK